MIYRKKYIDEIRGFYDSNFIRIITGVRRCGKTVVMKQIRLFNKQCETYKTKRYSR